MNLCKAGKSRHQFVDLGIVFHSAGTERIELSFDREISLGKPGKMAQDFQLSQFGESRDILTQERLRNRRLAFFALYRPIKTASSGRPALEKKTRGACFRLMFIRRWLRQAVRSPLSHSSPLHRPASSHRVRDTTGPRLLRVQFAPRRSDAKDFPGFALAQRTH